MIEREFSQDNDIEKALAIIKESNGIQRSRELALHHAEAAVQHIACLKPSISAQALVDLADYVLSRLY